MKSVHKRRLFPFLVLAVTLVGSAFSQYRQVQTLSDENAALQQQVETLIGEKTALDQKLETLNDVMESLRQEKQTAEQNVEKARKDLNVARIVLTETKSALSRSRTQTANLTRKVQAAQKQVDHATRRFRETAEQLASTVNRLERAKAEIRHLVSVVREREVQIALLRRESEDKSRIIASLQAEKGNGEWASAAAETSRRAETGDAPGDAPGDATTTPTAAERTVVQPALWRGFRSPTRLTGSSQPDATGSVFRVTVTTDGTAAHVVTVESNGDRSAANHWKTVIERDSRWRPETQNGTPVPGQVTVTITTDETGAPALVPVATSGDSDEAAVPAGA